MYAANGNGNVSKESVSNVREQNKSPNNAINSDSEKRGDFVAPLFTAGYGERYAFKRNER
ncbi:uncharacterized protein sS8_1314 [Methylocaldum marinum]|uniref:Uncharacterized protein n=1 Tax=Methylocaldum marinum TaxID=1432792 RepID=A0A250KNZ6_9GAMM|nr:uncharacterized protein sS8_1314 [Methylocaldum marinum]